MSKKIIGVLFLLGTWLFICGAKSNEPEEQPQIVSLVITEPPIAVIEPVIAEVEPEVVNEPVSLGEYKLTAYCSCSKCCGKWADNRPDGIVYGSIGKELIAGYSIAVDPDVIPYGTVVIINGQEYEAMDCGGAIKDNRIDVYFSDHDEALEFGVQYAEVFLYED